MKKNLFYKHNDDDDFSNDEPEGPDIPKEQ